MTRKTAATVGFALYGAEYDGGVSQKEAARRSSETSDIPPMLDDMSRMWRFAREHGFAAELKSLHRPRLWRWLAAAAGDWAAVGGAFALALAWPWMLPLALIVVGNRQRALGNLLHDAAHGNCCRNRRFADALARWLLFRPMCSSVEIYRREHFAHHRLLGVSGHDVDLIHSERDMGRPWLVLLWRHAASRQNWIASIFAHLPRAGRRELGLIVGLWGAALLALSGLIQPLAGLEFAALWWLARATTFHLITTFREISDHVGLKPGNPDGLFAQSYGEGPARTALSPAQQWLSPGPPSEPRYAVLRPAARARVAAGMAGIRGSGSHQELFLRRGLARALLGAGDKDGSAVVAFPRD